MSIISTSDYWMTPTAHRTGHILGLAQAVRGYPQLPPTVPPLAHRSSPAIRTMTEMLVRPSCDAPGHAARITLASASHRSCPPSIGPGHRPVRHLVLNNVRGTRRPASGPLVSDLSADPLFSATSVSDSQRCCDPGGLAGVGVHPPHPPIRQLKTKPNGRKNDDDGGQHRLEGLEADDALEGIYSALPSSQPAPPPTRCW
jgi:hypothetical protein